MEIVQKATIALQEAMSRTLLLSAPSAINVQQVHHLKRPAQPARISQTRSKVHAFYAQLATTAWQEALPSLGQLVKKATTALRELREQININAQ